MGPMDIAFRLLKDEAYHLMNSNELARLARKGDEEAYEEMERRMGDWYGQEQPEHEGTKEWLENLVAGPFIAEGEMPDAPEGMKESRDEHMMQQDYYPPEAMGEMYAEESGKNPWRRFQPMSNQPSIRLPIMTPIHRDESGLYDWQYKNAGEPMDSTWRVLKDDTEESPHT
jgi:hypothetical protein